MIIWDNYALVLHQERDDFRREQRELCVCVCVFSPAVQKEAFGSVSFTEDAAHIGGDNVDVMIKTIGIIWREWVKEAAGDPLVTEGPALTLTGWLKVLQKQFSIPGLRVSMGSSEVPLPRKRCFSGRDQPALLCSH